jgi:prolyl oligopeptidase
MTNHALRRLVCGAAAAGLLSGAAFAEKGEMGKLQYPKTRQVDQVDDYHGTKISDPYRWLEDDRSDETAAWVKEQNKITFAFLESIPARKAIKERMTQLWDYEKFGIPFTRGGKYFYTRNDGLQNQSVHYVADSLSAAPRVLLDPNALSKDGTVAVSSFAVSDDARYVAYGLSSAGSDWVEIKVRDIATGKDHDDHLKWVKFSGPAWTKDGKGFFYSRYDEPKGSELSSVNKFHKLYYHVLGTPQSQDQLIYERPDQPEWGFGGETTDDGKYLVINVWRGTDQKNRVFIKDLTDPNAKVVELLNQADAEYNFVDNDGTTFWFITDKDAPRQRIVAIDITNPDPANWREIVPQAAETLTGANIVGNQFIVTYLKDAQTQVRRYAIDGTPLGEITLPGIGTAGGFGGKRTDTETFYAFQSYTTPPTIFRYDLTTGQSTVFKQAKVDFDPSQYETQQVFFTSKDGTRVPMFIVGKKGLPMDGSTPCLLYGYGGFNISLEPGFSVPALVWMELGGRYCVANIRGGGEYGKDWHDAGKLANKQNVFDDFIAAAEYLIANKYTSTPKLAIHGGSNGGLLVGACMTQRPDLFGAAIPAVGVLDMLRFHRFTIGWGWTSDYGCSENPDDFAVQIKYSPLHNLKPGTKYPATLITTGDHDDRVVPAHSFKFAARLQECQAGDAPVLIRIDVAAGHGAGKPTSKIIEERADMWAFLTRVLDMNVDSSPVGGAKPSRAASAH